MSRKKTREEHVAELAIHGRVELVGDYVNAKTKTLYRCLEHGEVHEALPNNLQQGGGLACCKRLPRESWNRQQFESAEKDYDAVLLRGGRLLRIGEYRGCGSPTEHLCLLHGEIRLATPSNCRKGRGLLCCKLAEAGTDTVDGALAGTHRFTKAEETSLYIYELANHPGYLKPGIAKDCDERADKEYGPQVCSWEREHRTFVFLPEQVLLKATRLVAHYPSALAGWDGFTEVRRIDADALVPMAQELMDELDSCANPWEFAIAHGLLTPAQEKRARVLIRAGVLSEAELASVEVAA